MRITFTGDLLAYHNLIKKSRTKNGFDFSNVFKRVKYLFNSSDYGVGNLEMPLCDNKRGPFTKMDMLFNTPHEFARDAKDCGFDMFTTANNHCMDFGMDGLINTIDILDRYGVDHTGTFKTSEEPRFLIKSINGIRIAFISFTYSTNPNVNGYEINNNNDFHINLTRKQAPPIKRSFIKNNALKFLYQLPLKIQNKIHPLYPDYSYLDCVSNDEINHTKNHKYLEKIKDIIGTAKLDSDIIVFCLHSGGQYNSSIGDYTKFLINEISNCGVDIIITNHPHCVLHSKFINNQFVSYSLGNFCFTPNEGYYIDGVLSDYGIILHIDFEDQSSIEDIKFNVIKNIKTKNGKEFVISTYDLYEKLISDEHKNQLYLDNCAVISRFIGKKIETDISHEYDYFKLLEK